MPATTPRDPDNGRPIQSEPGPGSGLVAEKVPIQADPKDWDESRVNRDAEAFKAYAVHFAFDSSELKLDEKSKVASVADHLKANPTQGVEIDGHCDERGTEEYNRSLGERRALALREELIRLGIDPKHAPTVSFGKDRPAATGHDESAWSQNRRGEFILLTPKPREIAHD